MTLANSARSSSDALDAHAPSYRLRAPEREEVIAMGPVTVSTSSISETWVARATRFPIRCAPCSRSTLEASEHGAREFVGTARSLAGGSGWVCSRIRAGRGNSGTRPRRTTRRLPSTRRRCSHSTCTSTRTTWSLVRTRPDIDAFMRDVDWGAVIHRIDAIRADRSLLLEDPSDKSLPSLSVEELAARLAQGEPV
jgi:hypothetical protein